MEISLAFLSSDEVEVVVFLEVCTLFFDDAAVDFADISLSVKKSVTTRLGLSVFAF